MENRKKIFRSRVSWLIVVSVFVMFILVFIKICNDKSYEGLYGLCGAILIVVFLFSGIRYIISDDKIYLKIWFISNGSREIKDIASVKRSYNFLASPAASLKRLNIHFKTGSCDWLISPANELEFMEALKDINKDIDISIPEKTEKMSILDWDI